MEPDFVQNVGYRIKRLDLLQRRHAVSRMERTHILFAPIPGKNNKKRMRAVRIAFIIYSLPVTVFVYFSASKSIEIFMDRGQSNVLVTIEQGQNAAGPHKFTSKKRMR